MSTEVALAIAEAQVTGILNCSLAEAKELKINILGYWRYLQYRGLTSTCCRGYHGIPHLDYCLQETDELPEIDHVMRSQVKLSLLFHDIYYDPAGKANEEVSAALCREILGKWVDEDHLDVICGGFQEDFKIPERIQGCYDNYRELVKGIDWSYRFGGTYDDFVEKTKMVRPEYGVSDETFIDGTVTWLSNLMTRLAAGQKICRYSLYDYIDDNITEYGKKWIKEYGTAI